MRYGGGLPSVRVSEGGPVRVLFAGSHKDSTSPLMRIPRVFEHRVSVFSRRLRSWSTNLGDSSARQSFA